MGYIMMFRTVDNLIYISPLINILMLRPVDNNTCLISLKGLYYDA